jgi:hypothetical protein
MLKFCKFMLGVAIINSAAAVPAHADAVVRVTLIDKSGMPDLSNSMRFGMHGNMKMARMGINVSPKVVDRGKVNEETLKTLGQVAEIGPNRSASITLELKPGKYILYCNIAGHCMAGM